MSDVLDPTRAQRQPLGLAAGIGPEQHAIPESQSRPEALLRVRRFEVRSQRRGIQLRADRHRRRDFGIDPAIPGQQQCEVHVLEYRGRDLVGPIRHQAVSFVREAQRRRVHSERRVRLVDDDPMRDSALGAHAFQNRQDPPDVVIARLGRDERHVDDDAVDPLRHDANEILEIRKRSHPAQRHQLRQTAERRVVALGIEHADRVAEFDEPFGDPLETPAGRTISSPRLRTS